MRKNKTLATVVALTICIIGNAMSVSAAEPIIGTDSIAITAQGTDSIAITAQETDLQENYINEKIGEKNLKILNRNIKETEDGDVIIREIETTYVAETQANIQVYAAYKSNYYTKEYDVYHKKTNKKIFHVLLDATFKYNNSYAYVSDYLVYTWVYEGASFIGEAHHTSKAKKSNVADVTLTGNISGKLGGEKYNYKYGFNISCSKTGKLSSYKKKLA